MAHIHREPGQHDATSSAYIVLEQEGSEPKLWLHRHKKLNKWLQFGGHVELHETPWAALVHELKEESGYELSQLMILQPAVRLDELPGAVSHPVPTNENTHLIDTGDGTPQPHYHTDRSYAFVTTQMPKLEPDEGESKEARPMTMQQIIDIPTGEIPESTRKIAVFVLADVHSSHERVDPTGYLV
jgi:8-oxo-dGTP pyrophosphatase MutT (NUDIX family)